MIIEIYDLPFTVIQFHDFLQFNWNLAYLFPPFVKGKTLAVK